MFVFAHSSRRRRLWLGGLIAGLLLLLGGVDLVLAQSGSRSSSGGRVDPPVQSQPMPRSQSVPRGQPVPQGSSAQGSASQGSLMQQGSATQRVPVALNGYCPVCILDLKKWVRGNPQHTVTYDGKAYYFPNAETRQTFLADPAKYVPALGGDGIVTYARTGQRVPGSIYHAAFHRGRLYLFADAPHKQMFVADPAAYANVDVAMDGNCPVCRVEMNKTMPGDATVAAFYQGKRYLFPGAEQQQMFLQNPTKYVPQELPRQSPPAGSSLTP